MVRVQEDVAREYLPSKVNVMFCTASVSRLCSLQLLHIKTLLLTCI